MPPAPDPRRPFGLIEGELMDVRVQFSRDVADYFKERQWHPTQQVKTLKNGDVIVSLQAGGMEEIVSWVLSWGAHARVLSPKQLENYISLELQRILKCYRLG